MLLLPTAPSYLPSGTASSGLCCLGPDAGLTHSHADLVLSRADAVQVLHHAGKGAADCQQGKQNYAVLSRGRKVQYDSLCSRHTAYRAPA
jgi:hypothetical protein